MYVYSYIHTHTHNVLIIERELDMSGRKNAETHPSYSTRKHTLTQHP